MELGANILGQSQVEHLGIYQGYQNSETGEFNREDHEGLCRS